MNENQKQFPVRVTVSMYVECERELIVSESDLKKLQDTYPSSDDLADYVDLGLHSVVCDVENGGFSHITPPDSDKAKREPLDISFSKVSDWKAIHDLMIQADFGCEPEIQILKNYGIPESGKISEGFSSPPIAVLPIFIKLARLNNPWARNFIKRTFQLDVSPGPSQNEEWPQQTDDIFHPIGR